MRIKNRGTHAAIDFEGKIYDGEKRNTFRQYFRIKKETRKTQKEEHDTYDDDGSCSSGD